MSGCARFGNWARNAVRPLARQPGQFTCAVGKKVKGARGGEFLALEEHGRAWPQEQQGGQCPCSGQGWSAHDSAATARVGNLSWFCRRSQTLRLEIKGRGTTPLLLPRIALPW